MALYREKPHKTNSYIYGGYTLQIYKSSYMGKRNDGVWKRRFEGSCFVCFFVFLNKKSIFTYHMSVFWKMESIIKKTNILRQIRA